MDIISWMRANDVSVESFAAAAAVRSHSEAASSASRVDSDGHFRATIWWIVRESFCYRRKGSR
jgi:hypothetical protein